MVHAGARAGFDLERATPQCRGNTELRRDRCAPFRARRLRRPEVELIRPHDANGIDLTHGDHLFASTMLKLGSRLGWDH